MYIHTYIHTYTHKHTYPDMRIGHTHGALNSYWVAIAMLLSASGSVPAEIGGREHQAASRMLYIPTRPYINPGPLSCKPC